MTMTRLIIKPQGDCDAFDEFYGKFRLNNFSIGANKIPAARED